MRNEYEDKGWKGWETPVDYYLKAYQIALLGDEEGRRVSGEGGPVDIFAQFRVFRLSQSRIIDRSIEAHVNFTTHVIHK